MARGVCRGVQAFLAESCCCCRGVSASVGLAWLAFDERRAVASRRVVRSSLPCLTVAVHRFAEPVKTEAVERTALLRLPCVSANQPALLNPDPGPRVDTLNHQLLHGLYTCCYTPIPRADQLQLATSHIRFAGRKRAAVWTRSLPSPRRVPDPLHSSALRRERQTQGTYNTPPHIRRSNAQSLHPIPGGTMDVGAHGRATAEHNEEIACARVRGAHRDGSVTSSPQLDEYTPRVRRRRGPQQTRHTRRRETQLITTAACALFATCLPTAMAQERCISLTGSRACPAFNASSISTNSDLAGLFPFLSDVTDTESFDSEIQNYVSGRYAETKYAPTATSFQEMLLTDVQIPAALRL
jgi:hypothetical protein